MLNRLSATSAFCRIVALLALTTFSSSGLGSAVTAHCPTEIIHSRPVSPIVSTLAAPKTGVSLAIDADAPLTEGYARRIPAVLQGRVIKEAWALAHNSSPNQITIEHEGNTFVKYSQTSGELVIIVGQQIAYYERESHKRLGLSPHDFFLALRRSHVRGGTGFAQPVNPFQPDSLVRHFGAHGSEFGFTSAEQYEAAATEFAASDSASALAIDIVQNGEPRTLKFDFLTDEVAITGRNNTLVTYYRNFSTNPFRKFFANLHKR